MSLYPRGRREGPARADARAAPCAAAPKNEARALEELRSQLELEVAALGGTPSTSDPWGQLEERRKQHHLDLDRARRLAGAEWSIRCEAGWYVGRGPCGRIVRALSLKNLERRIKRLPPCPVQLELPEMMRGACTIARPRAGPSSDSERYAEGAADATVAEPVRADVHGAEDAALHVHSEDDGLEVRRERLQLEACDVRSDERGDHPV